MARVIKDQASDDIWHLSIEDLLAPPREPAQYWSRIANDVTYSRFHRRRGEAAIANFT